MNNKQLLPPLDLWFILLNRSNTFDSWAASEGITTREEFAITRARVEALGEYYFSEAMIAESLRCLPEAAIIVPVETLLTPDDQDKAIIMGDIISKLNSGKQKNKSNKKVVDSGSDVSSTTVKSVVGSELAEEPLTDEEETVK